MARKRPQIRGQGADVFLAQTTPAAPLPAATPDDKRVMVTVYLPATLADQLDRAWLERRMHDRKAQKSHLVTEALSAYLRACPGAVESGHRTGTADTAATRRHSL